MKEARAVARTFSLSADTSILLDDFAAKEERQVSWIVNRAIREYIKHEDKIMLQGVGHAASTENSTATDA
jgi:predicted transcriptional regulator